MHNLTSLEFPTNTLESQEIKGTTYTNLSGIGLQKAINWLPHDLKADKVVLFPDLCPGKSPLPTGCAVELSPDKQPNWREFAVSDVGCGMQVVKTSLTWDEFEAEKSAWDAAYLDLKSNRNKGLGDLGSGNHFLDAVIDKAQKVYFVCHTGSRDESKKVSALLNDHAQFDKVFKTTVAWAQMNRYKIMESLSKIYSGVSFKLILDNEHNNYDLTTDKVIIRKGAVSLKSRQLSILPSSMDGNMALIRGTDYADQLLNAMSHGTGRLFSRSTAKDKLTDYDFTKLRQGLYIPEGISNASILTESPACYRKLDDCIDTLGDTITVVDTFTPIAYIGQI